MEKKIEIAIKESSYFIVLLSSNSVSKKGYFQKELKIAYKTFDEYPPDRIFILPIRLDECTVPERIENLHWIDLFSFSYNDCLNQILRAIKSQNRNKHNINIDIKNDTKNSLSKQIFLWFTLIILAFLFIIYYQTHKEVSQEVVASQKNISKIFVTRGEDTKYEDTKYDIRIEKDVVVPHILMSYTELQILCIYLRSIIAGADKKDEIWNAMVDNIESITENSASIDKDIVISDFLKYKHDLPIKTNLLNFTFENMIKWDIERRRIVLDEIKRKLMLIEIAANDTALFHKQGKKNVTYIPVKYLP